MLAIPFLFHIFMYKYSNVFVWCIINVEYVTEEPRRVCVVNESFAIKREGKIDGKILNILFYFFCI